MMRRRAGAGAAAPRGQVLVVKLNGKPREGCWDIRFERTLWLFHGSGSREGTTMVVQVTGDGDLG